MWSLYLCLSKLFFTSFLVAIFIIDSGTLPFLTSPVFKYPFLASYLLFIALFYLTLIQLKRVEMGADGYIVTNYFKTFKMVYEDIEHISIIPLFRWQIVSFSLRSKGSFGKKITFLASNQLLAIFFETHPEVKDWFDKKCK